MTQDEFNQVAWRDFIVWAWNEPEMRALFTAATGVTITNPKSPTEVIIDEATGASVGVLSKFIEWATINHWGVEHAPAAYRATLEAALKAKAAVDYTFEQGVAEDVVHPTSPLDAETPVRTAGNHEGNCIGCGRTIWAGERVTDWEEGAKHAEPCGSAGRPRT